MLAQQSLIQVRPIPMQFVVCDVQRVGDWVARECPECHCIGYVSIYPNREAEAISFITRTDWICKYCADVRREVDHNFYARGGDALVHRH